MRYNTLLRRWWPIQSCRWGYVRAEVGWLWCEAEVRRLRCEAEVGGWGGRTKVGTLRYERQVKKAEGWGMRLRCQVWDGKACCLWKITWLPIHREESTHWKLSNCEETSEGPGIFPECSPDSWELWVPKSSSRESLGTSSVDLECVTACQSCPPGTTLHHNQEVSGERPGPLEEVALYPAGIWSSPPLIQT